MDQAKDGTALLADFASDFGATVEIKSEVAFSPSVPFNKAENEVLNITPSTKRSTTQLSATSPNMPDKKKVRVSLEFSKVTPPAFSPSKASPPALTGYENRKDSGKVMKAMGLRKPPQPLPEGQERKYSTPIVLQSVDNRGFHYMHTPLEMRANALDVHTQYVSAALMKKFSLTDIDPIGPTSQDTQIHIGRICCESPEGKLNAKSILLEGSLESSNGRRIRLDVSRLGEYSLFPGQIVAVEGNNAGDGAFMVSKLYEGAPAPLTKHTPVQLQEYKTNNDGQPTVVWAASGPYTTNDNMKYEPLADLFQNVIKAPVKPDVLILMGPFVDVEHPVVRTGHITEEINGNKVEDLTFEECFRLYIAEPILGFVIDNPDIKTKIMLAPALSDAHHTYCFPQPSFVENLFRYDEGQFDLIRDGRVVLVSNPATIKINDVTIGLTTADTVTDIVTESICKNGAKRVNRVQRGLQHVLSQRHFYPLFPTNRRVPLDLAKLKSAQFPNGGKNAPDIFLLRSKLNYFIHNAYDVLCVNAGVLAKGSAGGTYVRINVYPLDKIGLKNKTPQNHEIVNRCSIEIARI